MPRPWTAPPPNRLIAAAALLISFLAPLLLPGQEPVPASPAEKAVILFLGDSITAGFGLDDPESEAYPALLRRKIEAAGLNYRVVNAGVSGDTSAGGLRRIDWAMRGPVDILVIELGGNDGLRGLPVEETQRNLQGIIDRAKARNPNVRIVIGGMRIPPNMGPDYVARFAAIYQQLAGNNPGAVLLPFLLEGVGGIARYNQPDHIHPTAEGHRLIADTVWRVLEPMCRAGLMPK